MKQQSVDLGEQLVPHDLLLKSDKILFITHLALGDFTYMQNFFSAFATQYPHIKIHIWVDEVRRTRCFWRWNGLKKYALYDWLAACPWVSKIYNQTYSPASMKKSICQARAEAYPIIVSLATLRSAQYIRLAYTINSKAYIVGLRQPTSMFNVRDRLTYKKMRAALPAHDQNLKKNHISGVYAHWFAQFFGVFVEEEGRFPFVAIPAKWVVAAKLRFLKWGIDKRSKKFSKIIFINPYAKTEKRSWPLKNVVELINTIKRRDEWGDVSFIINIVPEAMAEAKSFFKKYSLTNIYLFSAEYSFFQLPATIQLCDLVISVETSVMHLANALKVPVVALMRQKNPEWAPIDVEHSIIITTSQRKEWVCDIPPSYVFEAFDRSSHIFQKLHQE